MTTDAREAFAEARAAGLRKRHEQRLARDRCQSCAAARYVCSAKLDLSGRTCCHHCNHDHDAKENAR